MLIVGIIGPYISGGNRRRIDHNIANAAHVAKAIAEYFAQSQLVGFFCPHQHTARFEVIATAPESYYHVLDDEMYRRACDGFVMLPDWTQSAGARRDFANALALKHPIFTLASYDDADIADLRQRLDAWARQRK